MKTVMGNRKMIACIHNHKRYESKQHFIRISKAAGLEWKDENTIIEKWLWKLKDCATKDHFERLHTGGCMGCERYVEWKRRVG